MTYPLVPEGWTDSINQNIYASVVVLIVQYFGYVVLRFLRWGYRGQPPSKLVGTLGWLWLLVPPVLVFVLALFGGYVNYIVASALLLSVMPVAVVMIRAYTKLAHFNIMGFEDVIVNPGIDAYCKFLSDAHSAFWFQGVGAEKLTRNFEIFQSMVSRCGTPASPVRLLLVSPEASWLKDGAIRRGLGRSSFSDKQVESLQRVARVRNESNGQIVVRFYSSRPVFRMMFANQSVCWLGHYTESAAMRGQNEYAEQSNSSMVLGKPTAKAPDKQLYGALEMYFEEQWDSAKEEEWDFKRFLN